MELLIAYCWATIAAGLTYMGSYFLNRKDAGWLLGATVGVLVFLLKIV